MANRLEGNLAAITGGNQGIGLAIAQEGADVAFCYRSNQARAEELAAGIQKLGRKAIGFQCGVGRVADGQKCIADTVAQFGKTDILVNNAGLERHANFRDAAELRRGPERQSKRSFFHHAGIRETPHAGEARRQGHQHQLGA